MGLLCQRYDELVANTFANTSPESVNKRDTQNNEITSELGSRRGFGGAEEARTPDPLLAKQVLSQLSYSPITWPKPQFIGWVNKNTLTAEK